MADLASFGGITRIRFKGSSEFLRTSQPLAPPLCDFRIGLDATSKVDRPHRVGRCQSTRLRRHCINIEQGDCVAIAPTAMILTNVANYLVASVFTLV